MIKIVPGGEFETNNRTVAATKLQENDMLLSVQPADGMKEAVIQTTSGIFLRFPIEEISEMKKNAKGVRGIKLGRTESLEAIHLLDGTEDDPIVMYKEKTGSFEPFENRGTAMAREAGREARIKTERFRDIYEKGGISYG